MKARVSALFVLCCALAACGGGGGGSNPGDPPPTTVVTGGGATPTPTPTVTPTPTPTPTATPFPLGALSKGIYVADYYDNEVVEYAPGSTGNTSTVATISGATSCVSLPTGVALDTSNRIYVANEAACPAGHGGGGSVTIYAAGANGDVAPTYSIFGPTGGFQAEAIALDAAANVYVGLGQNWPEDGFKFSAGSSGNAAPIATYQNTCGGCNFAPLVVTASGSVAIHDAIATFSLFSASSTGTVAANATLVSQYMPTIGGASLDPYGNIIVTTNGEGGGTYGTQPVAVLTFSGNATGTATPTKKISGPDTGLQNLYGVATDKNGYTYVLNSPVNYTGTNCAILVFAPGANGDAAPVATIPSVCGRGIAAIP